MREHGPPATGGAAKLGDRMLEIDSAVRPDHERRHEAGPELLWNESYYMDWFAEDGSLGGYIRVGLYPNLNTVWYWACLVRPGAELVTVVDHAVALPKDPASLEIRHEGLWADHHVADAVNRLDCSLESFAIQVEDPAEMYRLEPRGERVPFGFELEFETDRGAYLWPPVTERYEIPCRVDGKILVGSEEIEFSGWGQRDHSWGSPRDWWSNHWCWSAGRLEDGTRFHSAGAFFDGSDWGVAYMLGGGADGFEEFTEVRHQWTEGREGLVERASLGIGDLSMEVTPLAWSPVLLVHPDGRQARFPRALARFDAADGRVGYGWIEWNQPPPAV